MSIQAVAWALDQDLPARPKLVLVSIANHANHTDGYCWLKVETIASEASCSPRAVFNFIAALIRNGYIRKSPRRGDDGKQRANDYWILLARAEAKWITTGADEPSDTEDAEPQDVVEPHARGAVGETVENPPEKPVDIPVGACGPTAPGFSHKDSAEPSKPKPEEARAAGYVPRGYRPPPEPKPHPVGSIAGAKAELIFVFDGTPAYEAWARHQARKNGTAKWHLTTTKVVNGEAKRGWYFPTLFPPKADNNSGSDPPKGGLATEEEINQFGQTG
jgi:hypothetical protein